MPTPITITDVVSLLGLEINPRQSGNEPSFNVRCPFCGDTKYHMNINTQKNAYKCFKCGDKGGGALELYAQAALGTHYIKGPGGNGRKIAQAIRAADHRGILYEPRRQVEVIKGNDRASDDICGKTYEALFSFPEFSLTDKHRANLIERGLDETSITENGYASIPARFDWVNKPEYQKDIEAFIHLHVEEECRKYSQLKRMSAAYLKACFVVGQYLWRAGCELKGVPGSFMLAKRWLFKLESGMLIPTRNFAGHIVGAQVRKDIGSLRYLTISSKGLPEAVDQNITRAHFPLHHANGKYLEMVCLTEGPLKSDVATCLWGKPICFLAIQGVNNRNDLPHLLSMLKEHGCKIIYNYFDMDKLTNPSVAKAMGEISNLISDAGIKAQNVYWDKNFAAEVLKSLEKKAKELDIPPANGKNVFENVLYYSQIVYSPEYLKRGEEVDIHWNDKTKGIDDYLRFLKQT